MKQSDFKTCAESAFCRRGRALAQRAIDANEVKVNSWESPYSIDGGQAITFSPSQSSFVAPIKSSLYPNINFELEVRIHEDGVVRVRVDEVGGLRKRYDETASWALVGEPVLAESGSVKWTHGDKELKGAYKGVEVCISYSPFKISLWRQGREEIVLNGQGLFHMEHFRVKPAYAVESKSQGEKGSGKGVVQTVLKTIIGKTETPINPNAWFEGDDDEGHWEETFNEFRDSKPKGPESHSLDIFFPGHAHVYGLPQHAAPLSLPTTTGPNSYFSEPYRLYNLDVGGYEASSTISLYGTIPLLHAHSENSTVGIFSATASEAWVDVSHPTKDKSTLTHWISESGILDLFLLPGPTVEDIFKQYARLTGTTPMPAHWALGYHQCRWGYMSSDELREVGKKLDEDGFPVDVLWLDIDYAQDFKYLTWDSERFPDPMEMITEIAEVERKVVVIVDPHLKRAPDYPPYQQAADQKILVKDVGGEAEYEGKCWPGDSTWVDWLNPASRDWWASFFKLADEAGVEWRWKDTTGTVFIWNDMNEPSVFGGPEITMPKDNIHHGGWEHRDVHNLYGMLYHNSTAQALVKRQETPKRPFVLSRSFYAGSQRHGAIWTGDNIATWEHMAVGIPMLLSNGIAGMTFAGADVGGFYGDPDAEMLTRWYQVGIFAPFFRAHAYRGTEPREPYLLEEPYKSIVRQTIRLRYSLIPVWYTAFREASVTGVPILRPHYVMFPKDKAGFAIDNQYYLGSSGLLVKPITEPGVTETQIYLAEDQVYYDYLTHEVYHGSSTGKNVTVPAPLETVPLLIRGGSIIPTRATPRRSSPLMKQDPFTLTIALDKSGAAKGELYMDDGETYQHHKGEIVWRGFKAEKSGGKALKITSVDLAHLTDDAAVDGVTLDGIYEKANAFTKSLEEVIVEKVIVVGLNFKPKQVKVVGAEVDWEYVVRTTGSSVAMTLVIENPGCKVVQDWQISVEV